MKHNIPIFLYTVLTANGVLTVLLVVRVTIGTVYCDHNTITHVILYQLIQ